MRYLYTAAYYLALPFILLRLLWRNAKFSPMQNIGERLGFYSMKPQTASIWLHAVSYGEAVAAEPLIKQLRNKFPQLDIVVSTMTATGANRVKSTWREDSGIKHIFVPYDIPFAIKRFFKTSRPLIGIIMETELWPNLLHTAGRQNIPLVLANARLSPSSFKGYKRIARFLLPYLQNIQIAAQSKQDAERFLALGIPPKSVITAGNLKFDIEPPWDQINKGLVLKATLSHRFVIVAASTHSNEEEQLLDVFSRLQKLFPNLLLILVPRHPQRFDEVASLCIKKGHNIARRSRQESPQQNTTVFLGDSMGELYFYYALSDIAFVGGSLTPIGGHNLLEPAAVRLPIVTGPHTHNFSEISSMLIDCGTLSKVANLEELYTVFCQLLNDKDLREKKGSAGYKILEKNQGAVVLHLETISQLLLPKKEIHQAL